MLRTIEISREATPDVIEGLIEVARVQITRVLLEYSDLPLTGSVMVTLRTTKRRNRAKDATSDTYIITGAITAL